MKQPQSPSTPAAELEIVVELNCDLPLQAAEVKLLQELMPELLKDVLWQMNKE